MSTILSGDAKDPALAVILKEDRKFSADAGTLDNETIGNSNFKK